MPPRVAFSALLIVAFAAVPLAASPAAASPSAVVSAVPGEGPAIWSVRPTPVEGQPDRSNFGWLAKPSETVRDSVRIRNFGRIRLPLTLYGSDARTTETGALDLLPTGAAPTGVGAWVVLERTVLDLAPGETADVPFAVTVPADARAGDHVGGIATVLGGPAGDGSVRVEQRLGNLVQVRVDGPLTPRLEVRDLRADFRGVANPIGRGSVRAWYTVVNTGNVRMGAQQAVRVRGPLGLDGRRLFLDPIPELLPGDSRTFAVEVPGVAASIRSSVEVEVRPLARAEDRFGADGAVVEKATGVWSPPWTLLGLLVPAMAVPAAIVAWRQRRFRASPLTPAPVSSSPTDG